MPIPEFAAGGLLPRGIHDCTMDEVRQRFGTFQSSERRPRLFAALQTFADEVRKARIFEALLINGSFVTTWPDPNDIDLILVLRETHDFKQDFAATAVRPRTGECGSQTLGIRYRCREGRIGGVRCCRGPFPASEA